MEFQNKEEEAFYHGTFIRAMQLYILTNDFGMPDKIKIDNARSELCKVYSDKTFNINKLFDYYLANKNYVVEEDKQKEKFYELYQRIIESMKRYIEMPEEYYKIITIWIIGTYLHSTFYTFPFLYINAMRGSGKTRLLKFIASLSHNGEVIADIREAVLFRTAKDHTIIIDEFEHVGSKEKGVLRELLNAAYKKGISVKRMKKVSEKGQEKQVVEEFDLFTPIAMANIWGIDEVLGDRCITIILEKSHNHNITRKAEDFEFNQEILDIKANLVQLCSLVKLVTLKNNQKDLITAWNDYLNTNYTTTHTTLTTYNYTTTHNKLFKEIEESEIDGRNFELMFPLFILAEKIGNSVLEEILLIAHHIVKAKKEDEFTESKDVSLIDFISHQIQWQMEYISLKTITYKFREFLSQEEDEERWLNEKWVGKAIKRLCLIGSKKRLNKGIEVILNISKAKEKIKMFKSSIEYEEPKKETIAN